MITLPKQASLASSRSAFATAGASLQAPRMVAVSGTWEGGECGSKEKMRESFFFFVFEQTKRAAVERPPSLSRPQKNSHPLHPNPPHPTPPPKKKKTFNDLSSQRAPAPVLATPLLVEAKQGGGKLKTKKAASKRIKVTATGKVLVRKAGKQHINEKMSSAKLNEKSKMARVPDRELPNVIKCLPYAGISK